MAPYDSDSSDDEDNATELSYTETDVLLGYAQPDAGSETVSRLGGRPDWLFPQDRAPSAALARCRVCQSLMVLLLQLNGELPDRFPHHERRLYVLACRNKACRRKAGSIRVIRGVRLEEAATVAAAAAVPAAKPASAPEATPAVQAVARPPLGEALFGVSNPFGGGAGGGKNPFAMPSSGAVGTASKNPFGLGGNAATAPKPSPLPCAPTTTAATTASAAATTTTPSSPKEEDLPRTFAEALSLNKDNGTPAVGVFAAGPPPPPEPWPPVDDWPAAYPVSWIADAEYETLDPASADQTHIPAQASMDLDDPAGGRGSSGKEDKFVFESSMDAAFQKFADRVSQNPDQVIRYEFAGQPLLYSKDDPIGKAISGSGSSGGGGHVSVTTISSAASVMPPCPNCRARRVFEVQLMPHAIGLLEADEMGLEGMDWGTVLVGVCEKDCQARGTAVGEASYLEEWAGVQWEDLGGN